MEGSFHWLLHFDLVAQALEPDSRCLRCDYRVLARLRAGAAAAAAGRVIEGPVAATASDLAFEYCSVLVTEQSEVGLHSGLQIVGNAMPRLSSKPSLLFEMLAVSSFLGYLDLDQIIHLCFVHRSLVIVLHCCCTVSIGLGVPCWSLSTLVC
jgi:hypothetical protein